MEKKVFIVNGRPGAGKDTFADIFKTVVRGRSIKYSSVDKVKSIAQKCGWDGKKEEKDRKFLAELKRITTEYNDMSFNDIAEKVAIFKSNTLNHEFEYLFIFIREPEEIFRAADAFGAETIFISSNRVPHITSNQADANVEKYDYDYIIENNGTIEDFTNCIKRFYYNISK